MSLVILANLTPPLALATEPLLPRAVLVLDATEPNSPWGNDFRAALRTALSTDPRKPVAIYSEILDLSRFSSTTYEEALRTFLHAKYSDKPLGVIVVHGPQALEIVMRWRTELWSAVPLVFASVDDATVARLNLPPDVTGTILRLRLSNMVTAAESLVPNLKRIVLVGDPFQRQPFRRHFTQELPELTNRYEVLDLMGLPVGEVKERVAKLPADAAILFVPIYGDTAGGVYISRNALGHISEAANRPIISDVATHIGYGSTGGVMATPEPVGLLTAQLALRILNGDKIADIPIAESSSAKPIFDWRQLQRFGISDRKLPPESDIRFRPQGMWEQYQGQLIAIFSVVVLQAAMIALLLFERRRRLRAELDARGRLLETIHLNRTAVAGALSAAFSHELNQPLAAILSNAEAAEILLKDKRPNLVQLTQIMEDIRRDDQRAGQIIKNVGSLLKRKNEIELQQFDLNDVVHGALKLLDSEASRRGVELSISQTQEALPVSADVLHLQQVILNLAINAMDAMVECGPGSRIMILKTALVGECEAEVSIADTGPGIASDKLEDVFNTFFTTKPHGTGLGLSIARTIVQTYGGTLWAENKPDGGAVFRFTLPLVRG